MRKFLIIIVCIFPMIANANGNCLIYQESMDISRISNRPYMLNGDAVWNRLDREIKTDKSSFYDILPWFIFTLLVFILVLILFINYIKNKC